MVRLLQLDNSAYTALESQEAAVVRGYNRVPSDPFTEILQIQTAFQIVDSAQPA